MPLNSPGLCRTVLHFAMTPKSYCPVYRDFAHSSLLLYAQHMYELMYNLHMNDPDGSIICKSSPPPIPMKFSGVEERRGGGRTVQPWVGSQVLVFHWSSSEGADKRGDMRDAAHLGQP